MDGNQKWLINVGGRISGPVTTGEIVQGVISGTYDLSVEVALAFGGWRAAETHPEIVEALLNAGYELGERPTESTAQLTDSTTFQNPTYVTESNTDPMDSFGAQDLTVVNFPPKIEEPKQSVPEPKAYQWEGNVKSHRKRGYVLWLVILIVGVGGWWWVTEYKRTGVDPLVVDNGYDELLRQADKLGHVGKFSEALGLYRQALELKPRSDEIQRKLVPLLLKEENQAVAARRIIEELKMALTRPEDLKEVFLLMGLADLYSQQWEDARESFDQSLALDSLYPPARFNRAVSYYMEGSYDEAAVDFAQLQSSFPQEAKLLQILSLAHSGHPMNGDEMEAALNQLLPGHFAYQQESFFVAMWTAFQAGDDLRADEYANRFLSLDMDLSQQHLKDPLFFLKPLEWSYLLNLCKGLEERIQPAWKAEAVLGVCHLKARDPVKAREYIEKSYAREPQPITKVLLSKIFFGQGEIERSKALLNQAPPSMGLVDLMELKIMELEGDYAGMDQSLASLASQNKFALQAEYYRLWLAVKRKHIQKAKFHLRKLENLSPQFLPARELESKIHEL